jgi:hypothetical protein
MKMKITEAQLKQLIRESLDEVMDEEDMDEGLRGKIKGAAQGFGQAIRGEWNKFKRGVMDNGLNNEYQGQSVGDRIKTAAKQIGTASRGGDKQQELDRAAKTVQALIDGKTFGNNKVLSAPNTVQAAQTLLNAIKMAKMGSVGGVNAAASKRYGAPQQTQQQPNQRQAANLEEDALGEDWWDQGLPHGYGSNDHYGSHGDEYFYNSGAHRSAMDLNESKIEKIIRESIKKCVK